MFTARAVSILLRYRHEARDIRPGRPIGGIMAGAATAIVHRRMMVQNRTHTPN